jgi:predicted hydrocarbon binding protein
MAEIPRVFPQQLFKIFLEESAKELGSDSLARIVDKAGFPVTLAETGQATDPARAYATIQQAMRLYFGRGVRGISMRIGRRMWNAIVPTMPIADKIQAKGLKLIPPESRPKPALELLARNLRGSGGIISIHTLDLDLLLMDSSSPSTLDQQSDSPICYVTLGLVREALFWATEKEFDVEEIACRAKGDDSCDFKVTMKTQK